MYARATLGLDATATGARGAALPIGALPLIPIIPTAGNQYGDLFPGSFVDLDPAPGAFHDYNCTPYTRDTHGGTDFLIRSFGEQVIGVPVFAALDGTVVFAQDGEPDMNTMGGGVGNLVAIDHGGGWETQYYHLKGGSVTVSVGEQVVAGQQIERQQLRAAPAL